MARILCVTAMYPPHHKGGYEVSCRDVMARLAARGHEVTVLTSDIRIPGVPDVPVEENPRVLRRLKLYYREDIWAPGVWGRWRIERHNRKVIRDVLAQVQPEVATVWHIGALSLAVVGHIIRAGIPIVYGISDDWLLYAPVLDRWMSLMRRLGPAARLAGPVLGVDTVVPDLGPSGVFCFISEATRERAGNSRWRLDRTALVYSGIDLTLFGGDQPDKPWAGHLLYVGRYDPRKGLETLIRAMVELPDCTLEVQGTGDDEYRRKLQELAGDLGVAPRVTFERIPRHELPARYRTADAFVFPSEWVEPFGLVPLEAMACNTPVVATTMGGSAEFLLDERNCLTFDPGDVAGLAKAVRRLADDAALRRRLVAAGAVTAQYFDVEHLADSFEAWILAASHGFEPAPPSRHFSLDG